MAPAQWAAVQSHAAYGIGLKADTSPPNGMLLVNRPKISVG